MVKTIKSITPEITPDTEMKKLILDIGYLEHQIINTRNLAEYLQDLKSNYETILAELKK